MLVPSACVSGAPYGLKLNP